jgi:MFS transporter, PPP family, 3-phenylpropionic acid transporter
VSDDRALTVRLAATYAAGFACFGIFTPYLPVWLKAQGLSPEMVGVMLAVPLLLRVIVLLPVTAFADRIGRLRDVMLVCAGLSVAAFALLGFADTPVLIFLGLVLAFFWFNPVMPLMDAYVLTVATARGFNFPRIRLWGSVSFVVANIVGGTAIGWFSGSIVPLMCALSCLPILLAGLRLPELPGAVRTRAEPGAWRHLAHLPGLVPMMIGSGLLQGSHGLYYAFASTHWDSLGYSGTLIGSLWAIGVIAEIALMWRGQAWLARFGAANFLLLAAAFGVLRWGLMALDPGLGLTIVLQGLHAATFGAVFLGSMARIAEQVPAQSAGSAQGMATMITGIATMSVSLVSGWLWANMGPGAYLLPAGLCALAGVVFWRAGYRFAFTR